MFGFSGAHGWFFKTWNQFFFCKKLGGYFFEGRIIRSVALFVKMKTEDKRQTNYLSQTNNATVLIVFQT